jgi:hypothetical protein
MLNNKTIAALLKKGINADIWYDAELFNDDGSDDLNAETIDLVQEAMLQAAEILEQLPTN